MKEKQIKSGTYKALEQQTAQLQRQLSKLLLSQHQSPRPSARRTERIAALTRGLAEGQKNQAQNQKEVSRLQALLQQQMVRLDTRNERLMHSLRLIARNAFYRSLRPFKTAYNNYRDDHELFRNLTQADGVLFGSVQQVEVYLLPTVNYLPKLEKIGSGLLAEISATRPIMPDGSGRQLRLHLDEEWGFKSRSSPAQKVDVTEV